MKEVFCQISDKYEMISDNALEQIASVITFQLSLINCYFGICFSLIQLRRLPISKRGVMNLTKILLIICFVIFGFSQISAQTGATISGRITENNGEKAIIGGRVELILQRDESKIIITTTDANGNYRFVNVPAGKYILRASTEPRNITPVNQTTVTVKTGENAVVNLNVEPCCIREEVIVIASGTNQNVDEVSKSISVVSNQEIEERNEILITDALRTIPGLRVQQLGGFGRTANIKTRGLRNQDTAVLIDGQRFRDVAAITGDASPFLSDLQVTNIERIEVLRGSGSSLYGTNAIGGVFNVQTDNFQKKFRGNLLAEAGGLGMFRGRANFGGGFSEKAFYNFGLSHTNFSKGIDGDDAARNTNAKASARFNFNQYFNLTGRFYFSDTFVQLNSSPRTIGALPATGIVTARPLSRAELRRFETGTQPNQLNAGNATFIPDANDPDAAQDSRFYNFNLALDGAFNQFANYRVSYQKLNTRRRNYNGAAGVGFQFTGENHFDGNIQTLQAKSDLILRSNTLTLGYEFEREKYANDNFPFNSTNRTSFTRAVQSSNTFFAQNQFEAFDRRLQLSGAVRAQFFNLERPSFSLTNAPYQNVTLENPPTAYTFDGSAAYFIRSAGTKLRFHAGNCYRVPSLFERFGESFGAIGAPNLRPELSAAFDAGIDQTFNSNRVRLSATYFYTNLYRVIGFGFGNFPSCFFPQPEPFGRCNGYYNTTGGVSRGGEFSAELRPFATTNIFTSYTYTNSDQRTPQVGGSNVYSTLGIPAHQFSLVATQRIYERLTLNFDFVATNSYLGSIFPRVYRFGGLRKGDLTASYEIPTNNDRLRFRLFGTIENIFNRDYYENGFRTARATGRGGLQLSF